MIQFILLFILKEITSQFGGVQDGYFTCICFKNELENCFIWNYKLFPFSYILKQWNILEIRITKTGKSGLGESYLSFHIAY